MRCKKHQRLPRNCRDSNRTFVLVICERGEYCGRDAIIHLLPQIKAAVGTRRAIKGFSTCNFSSAQVGTAKKPSFVCTFVKLEDDKRCKKYE